MPTSSTGRGLVQVAVQSWPAAAQHLIPGREVQQCLDPIFGTPETT
jgi:hypothetical protein